MSFWNGAEYTVDLEWNDFLAKGLWPRYVPKHGAQKIRVVQTPEERKARATARHKIWWPSYYEANKEKLLAYSRAWRESNPEQAAASNRKHSAKHDHDFGFNPLNSWFAGADAHHINKSDVIYLPRKLHRSIAHNQYTGKNMDKINALAGAFLTEDWT